MAKKMYDIVPPKKAEAKKKNTPVLEKKKVRVAKTAPIVLEQPVITDVRPLSEPKKRKRFPWVEILVGGGVIIMLLGIYLFFKLPKADIEIWPMTNTLTLQSTITADKSVHAVDLDNKIIPAQYLQVQKNSQQNFPATGLSSSDGTATGTITVYNKNTTSFSLLSGTHFLSDSGEYFVSTKKVTIPAEKNGTPGSIGVTVQGQDSGSAYNIGPSKFSLPKLSGTTYYYSIYGASSSAFTGGYTGKVKEVTADDISGAKDVLTKQLLSQAETELKSKITSGEVLLDGAMSDNVVNASASASSGAAADNFTETASVTVSALVFKKEDLDAVVNNDIASNISGSQAFLENTLTTNDVPGAIDIGDGKETMNVQSSVKTYDQISTNDLMNAFAQKSADQIKQIVDQMYSGKISQLKVNFWPFWVTSAPSDKTRIKVNLNF